MTKIGFLFPGQGAQFVGMGREVMDSLPEARELHAQADQILAYDLTSLCLEGPSELLNTTEHCQPALFVTSMAAVARLKAEQPEVVEACAITAGLSLGEYSALCFAGVIAFEDALRIVRLRGQAMQAAADAHPSGMVAVLGLETSQVEQLCEQARGEGQILRVANLLCPGNIVCSGHHEACAELSRIAEKAGAMKVIPLAVAGAFHTSLMQSAVEKLVAALAEVELHAPRIPVVSNVDARAHQDPDEIRRLLAEQIVNPVRWEDSINTMLAAEVEEFYEVGSGKVLRGLMKRIHRRIPVTNA